MTLTVVFLNGGISYNCDGSPYGATNLKLTLSNRDSGSHYFRFGYSDNMNTRGMIQYYRPNLASSEDELRFWVGGVSRKLDLLALVELVLQLWVMDLQMVQSELVAQVKF